jgi:hypothetical protein
MCKMSSIESEMYVGCHKHLNLVLTHHSFMRNCGRLKLKKQVNWTTTLKLLIERTKIRLYILLYIATYSLGEEIKGLVFKINAAILMGVWKFPGTKYLNAYNL